MPRDRSTSKFDDALSVLLVVLACSLGVVVVVALIAIALGFV